MCECDMRTKENKIIQRQRMSLQETECARQLQVVRSVSDGGREMDMESEFVMKG